MLSEYNLPDQTPHRQQLRNSMTEAEKVLWKAVRENKLGVKFRRQFGIGCYILDFYCPTKRINIEVDGDYHLEGRQPRCDADRDASLRARDITVIRFKNDEVFNTLQECLTKIRALIETGTPSP